MTTDIHVKVAGHKGLSLFASYGALRKGGEGWIFTGDGSYSRGFFDWADEAGLSLDRVVARDLDDLDHLVAAFASSASLASVTELDLSGSALRDAHLEALLKSPSANGWLVVNLSACELSDAATEALVGSAAAKTIERLGLSRNALGPRSLELIANADLPSLSVLDLSHQGAAKTADELETKKRTKWDQAGAKRALAAVERTGLALRLRLLLLDGNGITPKALSKAIFGKLSEADAAAWNLDVALGIARRASEFRVGGMIAAAAKRLSEVDDELAVEGLIDLLWSSTDPWKTPAVDALVASPVANTSTLVVRRLWSVLERERSLMTLLAYITRSGEVIARRTDACDVAPLRAVRTLLRERGSSSPALVAAVTRVLGQSEAIEEAQRLSVQLSAIGPQEQRVIELVMEHGNIGMGDAPRLVRSAPSVVLSLLEPDAARRALADLTAAGASAVLIACD